MFLDLGHRVSHLTIEKYDDDILEKQNDEKHNDLQSNTQLSLNVPRRSLTIHKNLGQTPQSPGNRENENVIKRNKYWKSEAHATILVLFN